MKKTIKNSKENKGGSAVLVGVGLAALAAAAAGTYYLYGSKNATKHRMKVKGWMLQAKGEILEQLENAKDMNEDMYHKIVNEITDRYEKLKNIDMSEMKLFKDELTNHWKNIKKDIHGSVAKAGKSKSRKS